MIKRYNYYKHFPIDKPCLGNLGLQAGSNTIRGLGTGHIRTDEFCTNIVKEMKSGLVCASTIAFAIAVVGTLSSLFSGHDKAVIALYPHHHVVFGLVLFFGAWISMMISSANGASTPIIAEICGLDPAKVAGPLETAFQDIVGQSFLLGVSLLVFKYTEPHFCC